MGSTGVIPQNSHSNLPSFTGLDQAIAIPVLWITLLSFIYLIHSAWNATVVAVL
jgi:hypothetical protein